MSQAEPRGEFDMMIVGIEIYGGTKKLKEMSQRKNIMLLCIGASQFISRELRSSRKSTTSNPGLFLRKG
jgi:hypothetical protein